LPEICRLKRKFLGRKKKKDFQRKKKGEKGSVISGIIKILDLNSGKGLNSRQIIRSIAPASHLEKEEIEKGLEELVRQGKLIKAQNKYFSALKMKTHEGILDHVNSQYGFVVIEDLAEDIMVRTPELAGAWDGDRVRVQINSAYKKRDGRKTGRVIEILERKNQEFVGKVEISGTYGFVIPNNKKLHQDIFVPGGKLGKARESSIVVIQITEWGDRHRNPEGKIIDVLGQEGENDAEMHAIMLEYGLPYKFPKNVENDAQQILEEIPASEIKSRRDFRNITTLTIDPADAKDFDDALSFEKIGETTYRIGIHIADVSYFLKEGSLLDKEAYQRATSVYLVDRTIPMLPEKLSNNLCSLRPDVDRLAFSAVFDLNLQGDVLNQWFGRTVIHSNRRFTYEDAQERIEKKEGDYHEELCILNQIAENLQERRFKQGSISFETREVKFKLDENSFPVELITKERKAAHKLVEDFMLLANKKVAEQFRKKEGKPNWDFVFRTHGHPDEERLMNFSMFAKNFGYEINVESQDLSKELNAFNRRIAGSPEESVLQGLAIRSMSKAKYTTENIGHFGLGFKNYTHFTSPIRRYPDVLVHRILQKRLSKERPINLPSLEKMCLHSSGKEKAAADAERASVKYKQVEFMQNQVGEEYLGIITGVTDFGIYVEISEMLCEGMVRIREMLEDFYVAEPSRFRIVGQQTGKIISMGDKVLVEVKGADINRRTIDLNFISKYE
jgi:ribonuclease R